MLRWGKLKHFSLLLDAGLFNKVGEKEKMHVSKVITLLYNILSGFFPQSVVEKKIYLATLNYPSFVKFCNKNKR